MVDQVTAVLPVGPGFDQGGLGRALGCLMEQTAPPSEVLIVANGLTGAQVADVEAAARTLCGPLARLVVLERAGLAAALNAGLREARGTLVARMDADDWCAPERLAVQREAMARQPGLAALGCAWEVIGPDGALRAVMRPAPSPARLRWSLRLGNCLAHGSMMLRKDAVLAAGGYDESLSRAQDYELWLRLTRAAPTVGAVEEVLYRYCERGEMGVATSSQAQAQSAAQAMVRAWEDLPPASGAGRAALVGAIAHGLEQPDGRGVAETVAAGLDDEPTREGLLALLWARDRFPAMPRRAAEACRRARLREVGAAIRAAGAPGVWLWGAGQHTGWVLAHAGDLGLPIAGVVDDALAGQTRFGRAIGAPTALEPGAHALISSDWHEEAIWMSSAPARARGVRVWRLYAEAAGPDA